MSEIIEHEELMSKLIKLHDWCREAANLNLRAVYPSGNAHVAEAYDLVANKIMDIVQNSIPQECLNDCGSKCPVGAYFLRWRESGGIRRSNEQP